MTDTIPTLFVRRVTASCENRKYELLKIPNLAWFPFLLGHLTTWIYNRLKVFNEIPGDI